MNKITFLLQPIGKDRKGINIAVSNHVANVIGLRGSVQEAVRIDTLILSLKISVSQNIRDFSMSVLPHQGNCGAVVSVERVLADYSTVRTLYSSYRSPALEVAFCDINFHFDCFLLLQTLAHQPHLPMWCMGLLVCQHLYLVTAEDQ